MLVSSATVQPMQPTTAYATEQIGNFDYVIHGTDGTGKHFLISYGNGIVHFGTYEDATGQSRVNNTVVFVIGNTFGIAASMTSTVFDTTLDYCCWNATASIVEQPDGTSGIEMYASSDYPEFYQFSSLYFKGTLASDKSTIIALVGSTTFETGDAEHPTARCDVRVTDICHPQENVGSAEFTWQDDFTLDTTQTSFINGGFSDTQTKSGFIELIQEGHIEVAKATEHFRAGSHSVLLKLKELYTIDERGNVDLDPYGGTLYIDKGSSSEFSVGVMVDEFDLSTNTVEYSGEFDSGDSNLVLGYVSGSLNLQSPVDFQNKIGVESNGSNPMNAYLEIYLESSIETVQFETQDTSGRIKFLDSEPQIDKFYCGKPFLTYNIIDGTSSNDKLVGTEEDDLIRGFGGDDVIEGRGGDDCIKGGAGDDTISGGDGNDSIRGGAGNDAISGDSGDDRLSGGKGEDIINGNDGDDSLFDGRGDDELDGSEGEDSCRDTSGLDEIVDCELTE